MAEPLSIAAYARLHGVSERTIYNHINTGVIKQLGRGIIDREQADRSWASLRRVRVTDQDENDAGGFRELRASISGRAS